MLSKEKKTWFGRTFSQDKHVLSLILHVNVDAVAT